MSISNGGSSRFSDSALAFGLERFENSAKRHFWMFSVRRFCGGDILYEEVATIAALRKMKIWIENAILEVETDGSRHGKEEK